MYRLTIAGKAVTEFLVSKKHAPRATQRIYRWGDAWGYLRANVSWDASWTAERHTFLCSAEHDGNTLVVEKIVPMLTASAPPHHIDDVWDEEIITEDRITCNNIVSIAGTRNEILESCRKLRIDVPPSIDGRIETTVDSQPMPSLCSEQSVQVHVQQQPMQPPMQPRRTTHDPSQRQSHRLLPKVVSNQVVFLQSSHPLMQARNGPQLGGRQQSRTPVFPHLIGRGREPLPPVLVRGETGSRQRLKTMHPRRPVESSR